MTIPHSRSRLVRNAEGFRAFGRAAVGRLAVTLFNVTAMDRAKHADFIGVVERWRWLALG